MNLNLNSVFAKSTNFNLNVVFLKSINLNLKIKNKVNGPNPGTEQTNTTKRITDTNLGGGAPNRRRLWGLETKSTAAGRF